MINIAELVFIICNKNQQMNILWYTIRIIVKLSSCSSLLKPLNSTLKVSIQNQKEQSWHYNHNSPTTHTLSFSSQTIQKIFSICHFQFSKFQNSWQLEILSKLPLFELDSKEALTLIFKILTSCMHLHHGACIFILIYLHINGKDFQQIY